MRIVTYISREFIPCLALTLPSWICNAGATVMVYTDFQPLESRALEQSPSTVGFTRLWESPARDKAEHWRRKIEVCAVANEAAGEGGPIWWLDADCVVTGRLTDPLHGHDIGVTRLINRGQTGVRGGANGGVLCWSPSTRMIGWFERWGEMTEVFEREKHRYAEQDALSEMAVQCLDGLLPGYSVQILSERIWNCEDDRVPAWAGLVETYRPKIVHLKNGWWKRGDVWDVLDRVYGAEVAR